MSFWKLVNLPLQYEPEVAVFCDVTEAVMKINSSSVCYKSHKHTFMKIHRTKDFDIEKKKKVKKQNVEKQDV